jgi:hypothetical protein
VIGNGYVIGVSGVMKRKYYQHDCICRWIVSNTLTYAVIYSILIMGKLNVTVYGESSSYKCA